MQKIQNIKMEDIKQNNIDPKTGKIQIDRSAWSCIKEGVLVGGVSAFTMWGVTKLLNKYGGGE